MRNIYVKTPEAVAVTASTGEVFCIWHSCMQVLIVPTGIAACNIGGITIHSFAGIGLGVESAEELVDRVKKNRKALMRWLKTKVLIIDEGKHTFTSSPYNFVTQTLSSFHGRWRFI